MRFHSYQFLHGRGRICKVKRVPDFPEAYQIFATQRGHPDAFLLSLIVALIVACA